MIKTMRLAAMAAAFTAICGAAWAAPAPFDITSTSFRDGGVMALKYSGSRKESVNCLGTNVSPQLSWTNLPEGTKSLALLLQDPEGRLGLGVIHWVAYNMAPSVRGFAEGEVSNPGSTKYTAGKGWYEGATQYIGPCPPPGAMHHYIFTLIASDLAPGALPAGLTRDEMLAKLDGHVKGAVSLVGLFAHP